MNNEMHPPQTPPQQPPAPPLPGSRASRAALCAVIPGIGAVYNHDYMKAVIHFSVFACLAVISESIGIFGLAAFCFYVYTIIDAYRSADVVPLPGDRADTTLNFPLWGSILILMGVLFLLDNLGAIYLRSAVQFWPVILIVLGGYLIWVYVQKAASGRPRKSPAPSSFPGFDPSPNPAQSDSTSDVNQEGR